MISAITNQGKLRFHFYREKMNQDLLRRALLGGGLSSREWFLKNLCGFGLIFAPNLSKEFMRTRM